MQDPIYLCTLDQVVGSSTDDRAAEQLDLLASILKKLGYQLVSGEAPRFNEQWASRIDQGNRLLRFVDGGRVE